MAIALRDGRRLGYSELGEPSGAPLIHCHGVPGCRLEHETQDMVFRRLGVRVITPDRPGYGLSDPLPGRTVADWAEDVLELADRLGIDRFAVTGLSGGGVFALSCAAAMPERITAAVTTGCPAPFTAAGARVGLPARFRAGLWLAARAPWLMTAGAGLAARAVRMRPEYFVDRVNRDNLSDRGWLSRPAVRAGAAETVREAFHSGGHGYAEDVNALARPWGFDLGQIKVPVLLWHGDTDAVIPPGHGRYLASMIPRSTLTVWPGEGHMLMWNHICEIVAAATGRGQGKDVNSLGSAA